MAPATIQQILLSPAELSYLHASLSLTPPIRPDSRTATQFRPLVAESDILPGTNGSARICFADGTEAVVGVKAEVEKSPRLMRMDKEVESELLSMETDDNDEEDKADREGEVQGQQGRNEWLDLSVEIPGTRDDDSLPVFLASMLSEALLADGQFTRMLWINRRFHWKLYIDILLLSPPLSYPLPLLSLTTHLALLSSRLPALKSEKDEDPLFNDDWDAAPYLYPRSDNKIITSRPPITLLVISVADNIIFDPSKEELAVAETVFAISVGEHKPAASADDSTMEVDGAGKERQLTLLAVRTIDPPSRLTPPGVPNFLNTATGGSADALASSGGKGEEEMEGVWKARRGGASRKVVREMVGRVLMRGGVAEEVFDGLDGVELG